VKIFILANINSIHTKKWTISLASRGVKICLFTLEKMKDSEYEKHENIYIIENNYVNDYQKSGKVSKIKIVKYLPKLKKEIRLFQPDILHAHFASSYGLLGALCGFKPYIISTWGSDIFEFPRKSIIHNKLIRYNLSKTNLILATSVALKNEVCKYTSKEVLVTPFGIDTEKFKKLNIKTNNEGTLIIGTVKSLAPQYGIDNLIKAFKILYDRNMQSRIKLLIVGDGQDRENLNILCEKLAIADDVIFKGAVDNEEIPYYLSMIDVYVALSNSESFGVAILEASACEVPVVVSDVGGLPEIVKDNETGFIVKSNNPSKAALLIEKLLRDKMLRSKMGEAGRKYVQERYNWKENVEKMIKIYQSIMFEK